MRRIPRGLDVSHFQEEADRAATRALALASPVQALVRYYLRRVAEPEYHNQLLGNAVRVSATQAPRVHHLARYCESILHTAPVEVYVSNSPEATAFTFGSGKTDIIVITSTLADFIPDDDELLFLLGSQLGHVKADHVVYMTVAKAFGTALRGIPALGSALSGAANFLLVPWERTATLTADRAGLLCSQNLQAAARALAKMQLGFGNTVAQLDVKQFLRQGEELAQSGDFGDTWRNRPALARRIRLLETFYDSREWARIFEGAWDPLAPRFPCYFCAGAGAPSSLHFPLSRLSCPDCKRNLMVEELPCPSCCASIPIQKETSLEDITCPACEAPYLAEELKDRYRGALAPELFQKSAYRTLGVHPAVTPAGLRRALKDQVKALGDRVAGLGRGNPVEQKIRLYAAFKTLIDARKRREHDLRLEYEQMLRHKLPADSVGGPSPKSLPHPNCQTCGAPRRGPVCGLCGWKEMEGEPETGPGLLQRLRETFRRWAQADYGEFHQERQGTFDFAFHRGRRSLFFARYQDLDRPGVLRRLLQAASDATASARPGVRSEFFAVVEGRLDEALLERLIQNKSHGAARNRPSLRFLLDASGEAEIHCVRVEFQGLKRNAIGSAEEWFRRELEID
jgi:Zn-dependent protease with chaperone function